MSKIEYGVTTDRVMRITDSGITCYFGAFLTMEGCDQMVFVVERMTLVSRDPKGSAFVEEIGGPQLLRVYVNDWCKVIDGEGREHTIGHGAYPADEFNRMVLRLSRARSEYDWKP